MKTVGIEKARAKLGDVVDRVRYTGDPTVITRQGTPAALVAPLLGSSDRSAVALARRTAAGMEAGDAQNAITDLLYVIDRYTDAAQACDAAG